MSLRFLTSVNIYTTSVYRCWCAIVHNGVHFDIIVQQCTIHRFTYVNVRYAPYACKCMIHSIHLWIYDMFCTFMNMRHILYTRILSIMYKCMTRYVHMRVYDMVCTTCKYLYKSIFIIFTFSITQKPTWKHSVSSDS